MQKQKIEELKKQLDEAINNWKRALADYHNLEKRSTKEREEIAQFSNQHLIVKLLTVLDTFDKLEEHLRDEGLNLAIRQFREILKQEGLEKIEVLGRDFTPEEMECVDVGEIEEDGENKVIKEVRTGYRLKGRVIRPAQVVVGKKKVNERADLFFNSGG